VRAGLLRRPSGARSGPGQYAAHLPQHALRGLRRRRDCFNTCAVEECTLEYGQCFFRDGLTGCSVYFDCRTECAGVATCADACYEALSPQGFADLVGWNVCVGENCPSCLEETYDAEACQACVDLIVEDACADEATACFMDCTPDCTGRECGSDGCGGSCGVCDAGESCLDGQCEAGGTGDDCGSYFECAAGCTQGDNACLNACADGLSPQGGADLEAFFGCLEANCEDCADDACYQNCAVYECSETYAQCFYGGGTTACDTFIDCMDPCTTQACADACYAALSADGFMDLVAIDLCVQAACPICETAPDGEECSTCNSTAITAGGACADEYSVCYGAPCQPDCGTNECGDNGCGGSCGTCGEGEGCVDGQCVVGACDFNGFVAALEMASPADFGGGGVVYSAYTAETVPVDSLNVEMWAGLGGPDAPGTYPINDDDYATCSLCVLLGKDCTLDADGYLVCETYFLANSGSLTITAIGDVGDQLTGSLADVNAVEVTIAQDYTSTPVPNGDTWCVDTYAFDVPIEAAGK